MPLPGYSAKPVALRNSRRSGGLLLTPSSTTQSGARLDVNIDEEAVLLLSEGKGFGRPFPSLTLSPEEWPPPRKFRCVSFSGPLGFLSRAVACTLADETGLTHIGEFFHKAMFTFLWIGYDRTSTPAPEYLPAFNS